MISEPDLRIENPPFTTDYVFQSRAPPRTHPCIPSYTGGSRVIVSSKAGGIESSSSRGSRNPGSGHSTPCCCAIHVGTPGLGAYVQLLRQRETEIYETSMKNDSLTGTEHSPSYLCPRAPTIFPSWQPLGFTTSPVSLPNPFTRSQPGNGT